MSRRGCNGFVSKLIWSALSLRFPSLITHSILFCIHRSHPNFDCHFLVYPTKMLVARFQNASTRLEILVLQESLIDPIWLPKRQPRNSKRPGQIPSETSSLLPNRSASRQWLHTIKEPKGNHLSRAALFGKNQGKWCRKGAFHHSLYPQLSLACPRMTKMIGYADWSNVQKCVQISRLGHTRAEVGDTVQGTRLCDPVQDAAGTLSREHVKRICNFSVSL